MARSGNNPKRRILESGKYGTGDLESLADRLRYVGSANHKRSPGDYGFHPPTNPRPWKSLCDSRETILLAEARRLFRAGILKGMVSTHFEDADPKYVWSVDESDHPYEAKIGSDGYHGYRLEVDDDMAALVLKAWKER